MDIKVFIYLCCVAMFVFCDAKPKKKRPKGHDPRRGRFAMMDQVGSEFSTTAEPDADPEIREIAPDDYVDPFDVPDYPDGWEMSFPELLEEFPGHVDESAPRSKRSAGEIPKRRGRKNKARSQSRRMWDDVEVDPPQNVDAISTGEDPQYRIGGDREEYDPRAVPDYPDNLEVAFPELLEEFPGHVDESAPRSKRSAGDKPKRRGRKNKAKSQSRRMWDVEVDPPQNIDVISTEEDPEYSTLGDVDEYDPWAVQDYPDNWEMSFPELLDEFPVSYQLDESEIRRHRQKRMVDERRLRRPRPEFQGARREEEEGEGPERRPGPGFISGRRQEEEREGPEGRGYEERRERHHERRHGHGRGRGRGHRRHGHDGGDRRDGGRQRQWWELVNGDMRISGRDQDRNQGRMGVSGRDQHRSPGRMGVGGRDHGRMGIFSGRDQGRMGINGRVQGRMGINGRDQGRMGINGRDQGRMGISGNDQPVNQGRNRDSRLSRLLASLPEMPSFSWDRLPSISGQVELGPGFDLDWDLDIDGLFEGDVEWWKGPNVCRREEVDEVNNTATGGRGIFHHHFFSSMTCDATESSYKCTTEIGMRDKKRKVVKIYECCHGYQRQDGEIGCPIALELKSVMETARSLGGGEFVEAVQDLGFSGPIDEGNFTMFLPTNVSSNVFLPSHILDEPMESNVLIVSPEMVSMVSDIRESLMTHVVEGFHRSSQFSDEMLLETENPQSSIRINMYSTPRRLVTANCRVVKTTDNLATNGVVHEVDGEIPAASTTIWDTLRKDSRLTSLATILKKLNLDEEFKLDGQFTVFAPSNAAFARMNKLKKDRLLQSNECMKNVLRNHILPNVICGSVIQGQVRSPNVLKKSLNLTRDEEGQVHVEGVTVSDMDVMTSNGVIHVIEDVIIPEEAMGMKESLKNVGHSKFFRLVEEAGLSKQFSNLDDATFFVPTDAAFESLSEEVFQGQDDDTEAVAKLLRYHVVPKEVSSEKFLSNDDLPTVDSDKKISIKKHFSHPFRNRHYVTAQCARVIQSDIQGCEGVVHIVDKVLVPPRGDLLDVLYQDDKYSRLVATLKELEIAEELQSQDQELTLFAPTNEAFEKLEKKEAVWNYLQQNHDEYKKVLQNHMAIGRLCCSGVHESRWFIHPRQQTLDGGAVILKKRKDDVYVNHVPIASCDVSATNGVVHSLDDFLADSLRRHVPLRPSGRRRPGQNWWERVEAWFDEEEVDDLFEVDSHWNSRRS